MISPLEVVMRVFSLLLVLASFAVAQDDAKASAPATASIHAVAQAVTIPAGTKIPIALRNAISTKSSHEGDPVYAQTTFPVVLDDRIVIPPGTYMQGRIASIKPAGRMKGRAEVMMHFTTLIYPSGYTVVLPGSLENAPAVDKAKVKDKEGTITADSDKGTKAASVAVTGTEVGALGGALATGSRAGAAAGAGIGAAAGVLGVMLGHGNEVRLMPGMTFEVVLQRDVAVDASRIKASGLARTD
jgi:type IV secretion system protein VirB10